LIFWIVLYFEGIINYNQKESKRLTFGLCFHPIFIFIFIFISSLSLASIAGTSAAGVAAGASNNKCGVGAAFSSKISGVQILTIEECSILSLELSLSLEPQNLKQTTDSKDPFDLTTETSSDLQHRGLSSHL